MSLPSFKAQEWENPAKENQSPSQVKKAQDSTAQSSPSYIQKVSPLKGAPSTMAELEKRVAELETQNEMLIMEINRLKTQGEVNSSVSQNKDMLKSMKQNLEESFRQRIEQETLRIHNEMQASLDNHIGVLNQNNEIEKENLRKEYQDLLLIQAQETEKLKIEFQQQLLIKSQESESLKKEFLEQLLAQTQESEKLKKQFESQVFTYLQEQDKLKKEIEELTEKLLAIQQANQNQQSQIEQQKNQLQSQTKETSLVLKNQDAQIESQKIQLEKLNLDYERLRQEKEQKVMLLNEAGKSIEQIILEKDQQQSIIDGFEFEKAQIAENLQKEIFKLKQIIHGNQMELITKNREAEQHYKDYADKQIQENSDRIIQRYEEELSVLKQEYEELKKVKPTDQNFKKCQRDNIELQRQVYQLKQEVTTMRGVIEYQKQEESKNRLVQEISKVNLFD